MKIITMSDFEEIAKRHEEWAKTRKGDRQMLLEEVVVNGDAKLGICNKDLSCSSFQRSEFYCCTFRNVNFANLHCACSLFSSCRFIDCNLTESYVISSKFEETQFIRCRMNYANFSQNNLTKTYWESCSGRRFDLLDSNLSQAFFTSDCNFPRLRLNGNVCVGELKGLPIYQCSRGFGSRDGSLTLYALGKREDWLWYAGCFEGSEAELRREIKEKHGNRVPGKRYLKAIDYLVDTANSVDTPHS